MMKAKRLKLDEIVAGGISSVIFKTLIDEINRGALFVYPTETIYGIGGIATPAVRARLYEVKKRQESNPVILIAGNMNIFSSYDMVFNPVAEELANAFWPGRLTLIVQAAGTGEMFGIRVSDHPFVRMLAGHVPLPLYSSSANISNTEYVNDPEYIYGIFSDKLDIMIDAGMLPQSSPSTVVDVSSGGVHIVREGAVSRELINEVLHRGIL